MATVKSSNTLLAEYRTFLRAYNRALDTGDTSLVKDLLITPYAVGARALMVQVGIARDLHILSKQTGTALIDEASNYMLEQSEGEYATVNVTFYTEVQPVTDVTIPVGTQVSTAGTSFVSPVTFSTISETVIAVSAIPTYYSYDTGRYEFTVAAVADSIGANGNVGAETITVIVNNITGIQGVTNIVASSGGSGIEDDDSLRKRITLKRTGRDLNVVNGLREYLITNGVTDAYGVRVESSDSERASGIDVFVITPYSESVTDTFTYYASTQRYYFTNTPVREVTSVVSASVGAISSSNYDVNIDNITPLRRSVDAQDYISIRAAASVPEGTTFTVTYTYSNEVATLQALLQSDANNVLTANSLVKRAFPLSLHINAVVTLTANADGPATRNRCRNALIQFLSEYRLGDDIQKSDLIIILQQGYGDYPVDTVDAVVINSYYLQDEFGTSYTATDEVISVGDKQYVVYGSAIII